MPCRQDGPGRQRYRSALPDNRSVAATQALWPHECRRGGCVAGPQSASVLRLGAAAHRPAAVAAAGGCGSSITLAAPLLLLHHAVTEQRYKAPSVGPDAATQPQSAEVVHCSGAALRCRPALRACATPPRLGVCPAVVRRPVGIYSHKFRRSTVVQHTAARARLRNTAKIDSRPVTGIHCNMYEQYDPRLYVCAQMCPFRACSITGLKWTLGPSAPHAAKHGDSGPRSSSLGRWGPTLPR